MTNASGHFLLYIGDDAVLLLPPSFLANASPLYAALHDEDTTQAILHEFAAAPHVPVTLLADTSTLHIHHEDIPPLSRFDRGPLLGKRLDQAFEGYALKEALVKKNHTALLIGAEETGLLGNWLSRLEALPNPSGAVCLLPVESASLLSALIPQAAQGWALMLSYHKSGGFRQIVTLDGELVFTRLTRPCDITASKGFVASSLGMEVKATRDYLSRVGLTGDQPLVFVAIIPPGIHEALAVTPMDVSTRLILSPYEAAVKLNLAFAPAQTEESGELVHALWATHKRRLHAVLMKKSTRYEHRHHLIQRCGFGAAAIVFLAALLSLGLKLVEPLALRDEIKGVRADIAALKEETQRAKTTLAPESEPLGRLRKAAERQRLFTREPPEILKILESLAPALGDRARVIKLDWANHTLTLSVKLTSGGNAQDQFDTLLRAARAALPDMNIALSASTQTQTQGTITNKKDGAEPAQPVAQITLRRGAL